MADLLPCPMCGESQGYTLREGSTYRWWQLDCAACGRPIDEARATWPKETTPRTDAADIVWNEAARHADGLRHDVDAMRREYEIASGAAQMHMQVARDLEQKNHELERLRLLTFCGCGDQFSAHDPGSCGACVAGIECSLELDRREVQRLRTALQEAITLMEHHAAFTPWREKWAHLCSDPKSVDGPSNPPTAALDPAAAP